MGYVPACTHFRLKMARCDKCKFIKQDTECRPSDEILCSSCHQDNLIKGIRAMAVIKECIETRTMLEGHEADNMTLGEQEGKDNNDDEQEGVSEPDDEFREQTIIDED